MIARLVQVRLLLCTIENERIETEVSEMMLKISSTT